MIVVAAFRRADARADGVRLVAAGPELQSLVLAAAEDRVDPGDRGRVGVGVRPRVVEEAAERLEAELVLQARVERLQELVLARRDEDVLPRLRAHALHEQVRQGGDALVRRPDRVVLGPGGGFSSLSKNCCTSRIESS